MKETEVKDGFFYFRGSYHSCTGLSFKHPTLLLVLFRILVVIANWIEKVTRDFLWSGVREQGRDHLVN